MIEAKRGDLQARAELVTAFMPLINGVARMYRRSTAVDQVELTQEGVVGVLRALERFDPELGTPFWGYASWWVRQAMQQAVCELTGAVVLSDRAVRQLVRVKNAHRDHLQTYGEEPDNGQLAEETGLSKRQVENLAAAERRPRGLEEPIGGSDGGTTTFGDMVADPRAEDAYENARSGIAAAEVPDLLDDLEEREQRILRAHYGLDGPEQTLRQLAGSLGVSAERVRQIEERALDKLRLAAA